jgi:hypothetical protein
VASRRDVHQKSPSSGTILTLHKRAVETKCYSHSFSGAFHRSDSDGYLSCLVHYASYMYDVEQPRGFDGSPRACDLHVLLESILL